MRHLYVHVPFCARRCSYCDFAIAVRHAVPVADFADALVHEWDMLRPRFESEITGLDTVYLGGGTPSLLGADGIGRVLGWIHETFGVEADAEITIEANPDDVTGAAVQAWIDAGVNRVSLGVQTLDDTALQWMHRTHDSDAAKNALRLLEAAPVSLSVDLIFGLPEELGSDPIKTLVSLLGAEPDHVSAYGLTVENGTALGKWVARGETIVADAERYAAEFLAIHGELNDHGFRHYEVSNYGRAGAESRHNRAYWDGRSYLGLGPSAHSFDGTTRWWNVREWAAYRSALQSGQNPVMETESLTDNQKRLEQVYLGLRTDAGIEDTGSEAASRFIDSGWARRVGGRIVATPEGWLRLDELAVGLSA